MALIAARGDLGAVTELWRQPAQYARFLGTELTDVFSGTLIVVMPNGYGVWIVGRHASNAALRRAGSSLIGAPLPGLDGRPRRRPSSRCAGSPPPPGTRCPTRGSGVPSPGRGSSGVGSVAWAALGAGALLILAAWVGLAASAPVASQGRCLGSCPPSGLSCDACGRCGALIGPVVISLSCSCPDPSGEL